MKLVCSIFLLVFGIWAIQPYFLENPEMRLFGYLCILFMALGYFTVWQAPDFYESVEADKKQISYILLIIGIISLLPSSLGVFFITRKLEIGWQGYSLLMTIPIGFILKESSKLISKDKKIFKQYLSIIGNLLWLFGLVCTSIFNSSQYNL